MTKQSGYFEKIQEFAFKAAYHHERDARIKIKLQALHHFQVGKTIKEVSDIVLATEKTVSAWIKDFIEFDYEGLIEREGRGRKPRLPPEEEEIFKIKIDLLQEQRKGGSITATEIQTFLAEEFNCCYSISGVYALLDRIGLVWITARSKHPKQNQEVIEGFKENFPEEVQKIQEKLDTNKIEIWWQDEARVGQRGTLSRQWATKGTRPRVVRQQQFISTYIYGAVCPSKDKGCGLILPGTSAGMMQIHLDEISKKVEEGFHGIVLMDRASWHTTEALNIPQNITLMPLPAYSPELNPVEQIWQQLRRKHLSNRCYSDYDDIVEACSDAWNCFCDEEGNIESLCSRSWAN